MIVVSDNISDSEGARFLLVGTASGVNVGVLGNQIRTGAGAGEPSIQIESDEPCVVADNVVLGNSGGPYVQLSGIGHSVAGNTLIECPEHAIDLIDCSESVVSGNVILDPGKGTSNTYDGIRLSGDSDYNAVVINRVRSAAANATRYGVNVSAATCNNNVVADNVLGPTASYGTASFNDAGTGTVTTRDANGQFTW